MFTLKFMEERQGYSSALNFRHPAPIGAFLEHLGVFPVCFGRIQRNSLVSLALFMG